MLLKKNVKPQYQYKKFNLFTIFRGRGGVEAEREERERWIDHERRKIQESVKGKELPMILCKIVNEITVNCSFTEVKCSHIRKVD